MPRHPRPAAQNPAPRTALAEPALCVIFKTASYPTLKLDEAEADMIVRVATERLAVPVAALLDKPAPRHVGQGDHDESLFEIYVRLAFAKAVLIDRTDCIVQARMEGPARRPALQPADQRLRLPRKK